MLAPQWITIALAYATLPVAAIAIAWARPRIRARLRVNACPSCGYLREGLGAGAACPECGAPSSTPARAPRGLAPTVERVAVALVAPGLAAMVAASITLAMQSARDVLVVVPIAAAPYVVLGLLILIVHRPEKPSFTLTPALAFAGLGNLLLALVMVAYWSSPPDGDDDGWPITDIALVSLLYLLLSLLAWPGWLIARFGKRRA